MDHNKRHGIVAGKLNGGMKMFKIQGHGFFEFLKLCKIARQVRDGVTPKGVPQDVIFEALKVTRPRNAVEMFGFLKAKHFNSAGELVKDLGLVSVKSVTLAFAEHVVDALCSCGESDLFNQYFYHKMGTVSAAAVSGDTALGGAQSGAGVGTNTHGATSNLFASTGTISADTTLNIREHGLFNISTGGTLLDRSVVATIDLATDDTVEWTYTLTVNSET